jgi:hypothetical protein
VGQAFALDNLVSVSDPNAAVTGTLADGNSFTNDYTYTIDWGDGSTPFTGTNVEILADGGSGSPFLGALISNSADGPLTPIRRPFRSPRRRLRLSSLSCLRPTTATKEIRFHWVRR